MKSVMQAFRVLSLKVQCGVWGWDFEESGYWEGGERRSYMDLWDELYRMQ